jgi:hypothetical protein
LDRRLAAPEGRPDELVRHALARGYVGVPARPVNQLLGAAGTPLDEPLAAATPDDRQRLFRAWRGCLWAPQDRPFAPALLGRGASFSVLPWPAADDGADGGGGAAAEAAA